MRSGTGSTAPESPERVRLDHDQRMLVLGVCVAVGATCVIPATYNYVVGPMMATFDSEEGTSSLLRQVPNIASLLVLFVAGVLGAWLGERRTMVIGGVVMAVGNLVVMVAPTYPVVIVGLALEAAGTTVLAVVALSVIGARIHDEGARASAFATFTMVSPAVYLVLPVLAGVLLEMVTWRAVAGIWALAAVAAVVASLRLIPAGDGGPRRELLTPLLAGVVCLAVVQAISNMHVDGSVSVATVVRLGVAAVGIALLVWAFRRLPSPSLSLAALRRGGVVLLLVVVALWCFTQLWYYMTLAFEYVFGLNVFWTAMAMVPAQLCAVVGARAAGRMVQRRGITFSGAALLCGTGVSLALAVAVNVDSPLWWAIVVTCLYSMFTVAAGVPLTNAIMDSAPPGEEGSAAAFRSAAINIGLVIGIAIVSSFVYTAFTTSLAGQFDAAGLEPGQAADIAEDLRDGAASEEEAAIYAVPVGRVEEIGRMQQVAMMDGLDAQSWSGAVVSFLSAGAFVWARRRQQRAPKPLQPGSGGGP
ncbi:MAG: MFS transporter [Candidatus Nanopelagicales bacterium]